jgi:hypothetical protein
MRRVVGLVLVLWRLADAAAQSHYGPCIDRARDRMERDWNNPAVGPDRARSAYIADIQQCTRLDAQERARDAHEEDQRTDQQRLDQQRVDEQRQDEQRQDQRIDQQRADQKRLDQQRRQREEWLRQQQQQQRQ